MKFKISKAINIQVSIFQLKPISIQYSNIAFKFIEMLSQLIENTNPSLRTVIDRNDKNLGNDVGYIDGLKNDAVALYSKALNEYSNKTEVGPFANGANGDIHQDLEYLLSTSSDRNVYAQLPQLIEFNRGLIEADAKEFQRNMNLLRTGIHDEEYKPYLNKYLRTLAAITSNLELTPYKCRNALTEAETKNLFPNVDITYTPLKYDRELVELMRNPIKNIDKLRRKLKLNPDTGYYSFDGIPYICKHEFMAYEGKSLKQILIECADEDYMCKYCSEELAFTVDDETIDFDAIQYRLIYVLVESLDLVSYEDFIIYLITHAIHDSIEALELESSDDYVEKVDAFTATYIYKLHEYLRKELKFKANSSLVTFIKHIWLKAGWNDDIVKQLISNEERFKHFIHTVNIICSFKRDEVKDESWSITKLFLSSDGPLQTMYSKDKSSLGKLVDMMFLQLNNSPIKDYKSIMKQTTQEYIRPIYEMARSGSDAEKSFFMMWWRELCPESISHNMKNGTCKHCGINEKNVASIYEKYQFKIHQMLHPEIKNEIKFAAKTRAEVITAIKKASNKIKDLNILEAVFTEHLEEELISLLESFIGIGHIDEIAGERIDVAKQMINYLISKSDTDGERLVLEINSLAIPPIPSMGTFVMKF